MTREMWRVSWQRGDHPSVDHDTKQQALAHSDRLIDEGNKDVQVYPVDVWVEEMG